MASRRQKEKPREKPGTTASSPSRHGSPSCTRAIVSTVARLDRNDMWGFLKQSHIVSRGPIGRHLVFEHARPPHEEQRIGQQHDRTDEDRF